jgi:hypothetical protein
MQVERLNIKEIWPCNCLRYLFLILNGIINIFKLIVLTNINNSLI